MNGLQHFLGAGTIGDIGWQDQHGQDQTQGIDEEVALAALDLFASIKPDGPLFPSF